MLSRLRIENLALIHSAEIDFGRGVTAVTGETGAGKTIFAQAIGLLLGGKGESSLVGPHAKETFVEAEFTLSDALWADPAFKPLVELRPEDEDLLVVSRRVGSDGRGRAYAWGRSISRDLLTVAGERLISLSGQFEQRRLAKPAYQLDLLDSFGGDKHERLREQVGAAWKALAAAKRERDDLSRDAEITRMRIEDMRLLVEQTESFLPGEEEQLKQELDRVSRSQEIVQSVIAAAELLGPEDGNGSADLAAQAELLLAKVSDLDPELSAVARGITEAEETLRELGSTLRRYLDRADADPERMQEVESRLSLIYEAKRRFREPDYARLLERAAEAAVELARVDVGGDPVAAAECRYEQALESYRTIAATLRKARQTAAPKFASAAQTELRRLAMGDGEMRVELAEKAAGPTGADEVRFMIRPNAGLPFAPAAQTASGGELSRIALALRVVAHSKAGEPTILFDEIDAGIGGVTAHAVADSLHRLGETTQVIAITHLPQIASVADGHLKIEKMQGNPTQNHVVSLDSEARKEELERMLGGADFLEKIGVSDD